MSSRATIFLLTFFIYASVHMMRMTYAFNKPNFKAAFGIGDLFLGVLDSLVFLMLAAGTLLRYTILNERKNTLLCLKTAIPTALAFSIVPLVSLFSNLTNHQIRNNSTNIFTYLIIAISIGSFGFFQFAFFPAVITIFSQHFNVKRQGNLVGIWSSKSNAGNIIGFFLANFMVYQLHRKWQTTMLLCSCILLVMALLLYYNVDDVLNEQEEEITTSELFKYMKSMWKITQFKLYILSFSIFKAILYSYELWTPSFLTSIGYGNYSGYVPMVFDISTLFGSYLIGKLYQQNNGNIEGDDRPPKLALLKKYKFFVASVLIVLTSLCYIFLPHMILFYFILGAIMGFILGGIYNALQNSEILAYTQNNPRTTNMLSTINIGFGSGLVGVFQIIIGVAMHLKSPSQQTTNSNKKPIGAIIYLIIAILGGIAIVLTFFRAYYTKPEEIKQNQEIQLRLMANPQAKNPRNL